MKQIVESPSILGFIKLSRLLVKVAPRQRRAGSRACLWAAAHRVGHFVAGNAVPIAEFLKLLEIKLFGHFPQRVVSRLRVTDAAQEVSQPLSRLRHLNPRAPCYSVARIARRTASTTAPGLVIRPKWPAWNVLIT